MKPSPTALSGVLGFWTSNAAAPSLLRSSDKTLPFFDDVAGDEDAGAACTAARGLRDLTAAKPPPLMTFLEAFDAEASSAFCVEAASAAAGTVAAAAATDADADAANDDEAT